MEQHPAIHFGIAGADWDNMPVTVQAKLRTYASEHKHEDSRRLIAICKNLHRVVIQNHPSDIAEQLPAKLREAIQAEVAGRFDFDPEDGELSVELVATQRHIDLEARLHLGPYDWSARMDWDVSFPKRVLTAPWRIPAHK